MSIKVKCQFCNGTGAFNSSCFHCGGRGCLKIGWIEFVGWQLAKWMKRLLEQYGDN